LLSGATIPESFGGWKRKAIEKKENHAEKKERQSPKGKRAILCEQTTPSTRKKKKECSAIRRNTSTTWGTRKMKEGQIRKKKGGEQPLPPWPEKSAISEGGKADATQLVRNRKGRGPSATRVAYTPEKALHRRGGERA